MHHRWATEDPNPVAKVAERKYVQKKGEEGIAAALDPDFVQAVREMDEFEGIVEPRRPNAIEGQPEPAEGDAEEEESGGRRKRQRIEAPPATAAAPPPPAAQQKATPEPQGILSAHALDSLKYLASIKQQPAPLQQKAAPKPTGLGGLADYGSDSDDE